MSDKKTIRFLIGALAATVFATACFLAFPLNAGALETDPYVLGEDYYIDDPEAFRDQDIDHEEAVESSASTGYYLTSPFYVEWVSPDETIRVGEQAFVGCSAVGFGELAYEWYVSENGGESFRETGLLGPAHTLEGLEPTGEGEPYLYRCLITNGDGASKLTADVQVTVLGASGSDPGIVDEPKGKGIPQLGDERMIGLMALAGAGVFAGLALMLALMCTRERDE